MTDKQLQHQFLETLCKKHIPVSIFLKNGIQLKGCIKQFDPSVIMLKGSDITQMIYRHSISTILPSQEVSFSDAAAAPE